MDDEVVEETDDAITVCLGTAQWITAAGLFILEEDYAVGGEGWRVHKHDPDPLPSRPHAHCVAGAKRFVGCKLHLGTAELYKGAEPLRRYLGKKQFDRLIELIKPKFPGVTLPIR